jgi:hypothetical protein
MHAFVFVLFWKPASQRQIQTWETPADLWTSTFAVFGNWRNTMASLPSENVQSVPQQEKTLKNLGLTLEAKQSVERQWQMLSNAGVQIEVFPSGADSYKCYLVHKDAGDILFQTPWCTTSRWEKSFFVHSSHNTKEAKLEAKMYVLQHIETLRVSTSEIGRPVADFLKR